MAHYSIQRDHVHFLLEATCADGLARGMKSIGSRLARAANRVFRRRGPVLADRYHLHVLRSPREVRNALAYVLLNARRHAAKLGRWFDGWSRCASAALEAPRDPPAVARPRTWLLRIGWRRRGLIDAREVPGMRPR